jgi:hypothetical protein
MSDHERASLSRARVSFVCRYVGVEHDRVLEQEALVAVRERGRVSARAVGRAGPGREVKLAALTRQLSRREGVDECGDRVGDSGRRKTPKWLAYGANGVIE